MLTRLNEVAKELLDAANALKENLKELQLAEIRPALLDTEQAARYLGISANTLRKYRVDGNIGGRTPAPGYLKLGESVRYEWEELGRWTREDAPHFGYREKGGRREHEAA
jgi:hypothetical protein